MSKKLKAYLTKLGIENIDEVITAINAEDDNEEIIDTLLTKSQAYAKPFLSSEFAAQFATERKTLKGKYFKEAAQKANKTFGSVLTNKELDDIIADPDNDGKTLDAVLEAVKDKVSDKTGKTDSELQKMLEVANGEKSALETKMAEMQTKFEKDLESGISSVKSKALLTKKLVEILPTLTSMNPVKAAALLSGEIERRANLVLKGDDDFSLHDPAKPEEYLKKDATNIYTFNSLVTDVAKEFELPVAASPGGNQRTTTKTDPKPENDNSPKISPAAQGLMNVLKAASA